MERKSIFLKICYSLFDCASISLITFVIKVPNHWLMKMIFYSMSAFS